MSLSNFIPAVWSARLQENLHKSLVFGSLCNRNYEGDIAAWGDSVRIQSLADITVKPYTPNTDIDQPEQLDGTQRILTINHGAYFNFYLNDVDAAQSRADLMDAAMRSAARKLGEDTEGYVLGVIRDEAGSTVTGPLPAGGIWEAIVAIKTALDGKHVPKAERKLVVPAQIEAELLLDSRFITGTAAGEARLAEGAVARACGFDIYVSADLTDELIALIPDAVTFACQITKTEAYRREKGFDDGVKGLVLCGAKVVLPDAVYIRKLTA